MTVTAAPAVDGAVAAFGGVDEAMHVAKRRHGFDRVRLRLEQVASTQASADRVMAAVTVTGEIDRDVVAGVTKRLDGPARVVKRTTPLPEMTLEHAMSVAVTREAALGQFAEVRDMDVEIGVGQIPRCIATVGRPYPVHIGEERSSETLFQPIELLEPWPGEQVFVREQERERGVLEPRHLLPPGLAERPVPAHHHVGAPAVEGFDVPVLDEAPIGDQLDEGEPNAGRDKRLVDRLDGIPVDQRLAAPVRDLGDTPILQKRNDLLDEGLNRVTFSCGVRALGVLQAVGAFEIAGVAEKDVKQGSSDLGRDNGDFSLRDAAEVLESGFDPEPLAGHEAERGDPERARSVFDLDPSLR